MLVVLGFSPLLLAAVRNLLHASIPSWLGILVYNDDTSIVHRIVPDLRPVMVSILLMKSVVSFT